MNFVVLSSSHGTAFQAVIDAQRAGALTARCLGLVTDRPDRGCIEKAKAADLPVTIVEKQPGEAREAYDHRLDAAVRELANQSKSRIPSPESPITSPQPLFLAALGWMFIFSPWFIARWKDRIINVHPALLPKHGGEGMFGLKVHEAVLAAGEKESGITIHLMDEGVDTGRILLQQTCRVLPGDTPATLRDRVQALERTWYPKLLQMIHTDELRV